VHTHMVVGLPDGTTKGGHVLDAHASPTLEVMVTVDPIAMHKRLEPRDRSNTNRSNNELTEADIRIGARFSMNTERTLIWMKYE
jgi:hypothetical protein